MSTTKSPSKSSESPKPEPRHRSKKSRSAEELDDELGDDLYIPDKDKAHQLQRVSVSEHPEIRKYLEMSKPELQKWLRHNGQLVTGRKMDLLLRCIDGEINGRIPGCPSCHRGQMQYDYSEEAYICRGYWDELSQNPIRCGHVQSKVKREKWHDLEKDEPVAKGQAAPSKEKGAGHDKEHHHIDHPDHQHNQHNCKVEANHPLVDLLEDMAYYHSIVKGENWGYKSRAFVSAARAIEHLPFEIDGKVHDALSMGNRGDSRNHVEKIGKSSAEIMQAFLDSGKKRSPHLEELKSQVPKDQRDVDEQKND